MYCQPYWFSMEEKSFLNQNKKGLYICVDSLDMEGLLYIPICIMHLCQVKLFWLPVFVSAEVNLSKMLWSKMVTKVFFFFLTELCSFRYSAAFSSALPPISPIRMIPSVFGSWRNTSRQSMKFVPLKGSPPIPNAKQTERKHICMYVNDKVCQCQALEQF